MKPRFAVPLMLLLLIAAFVAFAPATLVDSLVASASERRLRLADATGTVWRGAGALTDASGAWRVPLAWRASPLAALRGAIDVELAPTGRIVANGGVSLSDLRVALPARALASVLPSVPAIDTGGEILVDAPAFRYDGRTGDGALTLKWDNARAVVNGTLVDLGNVVARVAPRGAELAGTLNNQGGALRVAGDFSASSDQLTFNGTLTPQAALPPDIARALSALGPADASGAIRVAWRGALR